MTRQVTRVCYHKFAAACITPVGTPFSVDKHTGVILLKKIKKKHLTAKSSEFLELFQFSRKSF